MPAHEHHDPRSRAWPPTTTPTATVRANYRPPRLPSAIALNIGFVVIEAGVWHCPPNLARPGLADAGHNLGDVFGPCDGVGRGDRWCGGRPTARYTYRLKRSSILVVAGECGAAAARRRRHRVGRRCNASAGPEPVAEMTVIWVAPGRHPPSMARTRALLFIHVGAARSDLNIKGAFLHMAADCRGSRSGS